MPGKRRRLDLKLRMISSCATSPGALPDLNTSYAHITVEPHCLPVAGAGVGAAGVVVVGVATVPVVTVGAAATGVAVPVAVAVAGPAAAAYCSAVAACC